MFRSGTATAVLLPHLWSTARCYAAASTVNKTGLIKQLRERTGSPISDVKACLESAGWDMEAAYKALREKGLAAAAKKADRHAAEGLVGCNTSSDNRYAVVVEVNSETDFVARSHVFQSMLSQVTAAALPLAHAPAASTSGVHELDVSQVMAAATASGASVSDACAQVAAKVRENVRLRRAFAMSSTRGCVSAYLHQSPAPGLGRIASLVQIEPAQPEAGSLTQDEVSAVSKVGQQLAMHVAGMKPQYLTRAHVPAAILDEQRAILSMQASSSNKPASVVAKMVEGRLGKWYEDFVLLDQRYILDDDTKVSAVLDRLSKAVGKKLQVTQFLRVHVGEGLEAARPDFAAEVASLVKDQA